jgi:hypothetical protein
MPTSELLFRILECDPQGAMGKPVSQAAGKSSREGNLGMQSQNAPLALRCSRA